MAKKDNKKTGSPFVDNQVKAGKNYKAPKDYKPLKTHEKAIMAVSALPAGKAASVAGKVVSRAVAKVAKGTEDTIKAKKYVQMKNARVTVENKVAKSSPTKGSKVTVETVKKGQTPLQQTSSTVGRKTREATKTAIVAARGYTAKTVEDKRGKKGKK